MKRQLTCFLLFTLIQFQIEAQQKTGFFQKLVWENTVHTGYIVRNSGDVPENKTPFLLSLNPSVQTDGSEDWHQLYGFPRVGLRLTLGSLGNSRELGYIAGITPNMTIKTSHTRWYYPSINLGIGAAWFNKPYNEIENPRNFYIGSQLTAMAEASVQVEPKIGEKTTLITGLRVIHCSNSHYQVPNLGMNLISAYLGLVIHPSAIPSGKPTKRELDVPESKLQFNIRSGFGIHELARTLGPAGTPKYTIYVNDFYVSRRFGKLSNVHAGLEINYYKSYYNYIITNNFFEEDRHLKSTVFTAFLAHEFMIKRFSLLTQGGINIYNKFYNAYINQYKSEQGVGLALKKIFSSRLGVQYYLFDPKYNTRSNVFVGAYIKAHFGQADFLCFQVGVVL